MGLPESFWLGWYTVLAVLAVIIVGSAILYRLPWGMIFGLCLGIALAALFTGFLARWFWWIFGALTVYAFIRGQLSIERDMYKWTNGRPDGER